MVALPLQLSRDRTPQPVRSLSNGDIQVSIDVLDDHLSSVPHLRYYPAVLVPPATWAVEVGHVHRHASHMLPEAAQRKLQATRGVSAQGLRNVKVLAAHLKSHSDILYLSAFRVFPLVRYTETNAHRQIDNYDVIHREK
jgi:hypothetical protein